MISPWQMGKLNCCLPSLSPYTPQLINHVFLGCRCLSQPDSIWKLFTVIKQLLSYRWQRLPAQLNYRWIRFNQWKRAQAIISSLSEQQSDNNKWELGQSQDKPVISSCIIHSILVAARWSSWHFSNGMTQIWIGNWCRFGFVPLLLLSRFSTNCDARAALLFTKTEFLVSGQGQWLKVCFPHEDSGSDE
jgi:hypothetical protein